MRKTKQMGNTCRKTSNATKKGQTPKQNTDSAEPVSTISQSSNEDPMHKLFTRYVSSSSNLIEADGIQQLCYDMVLDITKDAEVLAFMYICDCKKYGFLSFEEFSKGMGKMSCNQQSKLKYRKAYLKDLLSNPMNETFRDFFKFLFNFHKDPLQKSIDFDVLKVIITMTLGKKYKIAKDFIEFMEVPILFFKKKKENQKKYMNLDQWMNLIDVLHTIQNNQEYDTDGAWPILYDEFYTWIDKKKKD